MEYLRIATPSLLLFGQGKADLLTDYLIDLGFKRPFLVIDPVVACTEKGGKILKLLRRLDFESYSQFTTNPTIGHVEALVSKLEEFRPDVIVGIGGGSAIDVSKASNLVYKNGGRIENYLDGRKGGRQLLPMVFLPTTAGTGSEASPFAVIKDDNRRSKRGIENYGFLPRLVILDPEFLRTLDGVLIAATGIDAMAHIVESYLSKSANEITQSSARGLLHDIVSNLEMAVFQKDEDASLKMLNASFASRLLYPRTGLTIAHALSHPLGAYTNIHHGLAVAFFLKESLVYNQSSCGKRLFEVCRLLGFANVSNFYYWLDSFFERSGIISEIRTYMMDKIQKVELMAVDAMKSSNIPSNPREVSVDDLIEVAEKSFRYWRKT